MRRENDTMLLTKIPNQLTYLSDLDGIKTDGGFIKNNHVRHVDNRLSNTDTLLVTLGQIPNQTVGDILKAGSLPRLIKGLLPALHRNPMQPCTVAKKFIHRQIAVDRGNFGEIT